MNYSVEVKQKLFSLIDEMNACRRLFLKIPGKDFSRTKKWTFCETLKFMLSMESKSLKDELLNYFEYDISTPSNSSFNQRRAQILPEAFEFLFKEFEQSFHNNRLFHGLHMPACDGSDLNIYHNPNDPDTYFQTSDDRKGYNLIHLNALYDLCSRRYRDAAIQPGVKVNECQAVIEMTDRYKDGLNAVFTADRGYESYNVFAHAQEKGVCYLIRAGDSGSSCIISGLKQLPAEEEYDVVIPLKLTRKRTKEVTGNPDVYKTLSKRTPLDFPDNGQDDFYDLPLRVVRFKLNEDSYECLITNLPQKDYPVELLKEMYSMRWGIETSFRELKYAIGMSAFHSKKVEYIKQEIWSGLILYNFCEIITASIMLEQNSGRKHDYQLNYTRAIGICHYFIRVKKEKAPPDVEKLIQKELLPIRHGRSDPRKVKPRPSVSFLYRAA